ncbi:MAG: dioxygenase, isopenicillin synthase [Myxococcaceae bacterium]|nr:dioxygenase, isopenicillin synthase [Myxococcaceae bacterium]
MSSIPTLDVRNLDEEALGVAFREFGFCALVGHDIDRALIEPAYDTVRQFFALPEATKLRYRLAGTAGARGYTPFRTEKAKDQTEPDLKEFWHVGRELLPDDPDYARMQRNVWPLEVPDMQPALLALYRALDVLGARVLSAIALDLDLPIDWFDDKVDHGNSILRPLHYPPLSADSAASVSAGVRSAAHEDINLITLMIAAGEPGLEILRRDGQWLAVDAEPGQVIVNVGDMLQRLTNHVLPSTTHRVVNPAGAHAHFSERSRYSLPFFLHPNSEFRIETLPSCITAARPNLYPEPISADDYLKQRLREIGLLDS